MKHLSNLLLLLCAALWVSGCSVEEIDRNNGKTPDGGATRLSVAIASGTQTRAVGDPLSDATANEKRIDRLAFIVHTEAEGMQVYPPLATGEQATDFPNKVALTDNGNGTYSATVSLTAGAGHDADIVALANLPEDYDYSQIVTWEGLLDSVTISTAEMPTVTDAAGGKAFVMQGNTTVALHKEKEERFSLTMERLVARIDITNMAYDGNANGSFVLTGARLLRTMPASYLYPHDLYASPDTLTVTHDSWSFKTADVKYYMGEVSDANDKTADVAGGAPDAADRQAVWHHLYTYENSDTEHAPTSLEISGTFRGLPITRTIPFEVTMPDGLTKRAVPLVRNRRYLVLIKPAPGLTDIGYDIRVAEWSAADTINVQPTQDQVPGLTGYTCNEATKAFGITPNKPVPDTLVIPTTGGTIKFTASCPFDSRVTFGYASPEDGTDWLTATSSEPTLVPDATNPAEFTYQREYTVTVKKDDGLRASLVNRGYIYIANGGNGSAVDTITVHQGANIAYADLRLAAIDLGGLTWAPVNVGGTVDLTTVTAITEYTKGRDTLGYVYQWGRNVPFDTKDPVVVKPANLAAYPKYEEACSNTGTYANISIFPNTGYAWFKDYLTNGTHGLSPLLSGDNWPRQYQPCPAGWRIPNLTETIKVTNAQGNAANGLYVIANTNSRFVIAFAGSRPYEIDNSYSELGTNAYLWTSTIMSGYAFCARFDSSNHSTGSKYIGSQHSIRCVQE